MSFLPEIVDRRAETQATKRFALIPERADSREGAKDVSWADFKRAADTLAHWIESKFGRGENVPPLGFLSTPFDLRYNIFVIAASKAGYKAYLPSPRNSHDFHIHLLEKISCNLLVSSQPVGDWAASCTVIEPPSLDELLDAKAEPYPWTKTWEEAKDEPLLIVHSSGSTGPPKPITWTHGFVEAWKNISTRPSGREDLFSIFRGGIGLIAMPQFHTAGLIAGLLAAVLLNHSMMLPPAKGSLSGTSFTQLIETFEFRNAFVPPSILEDVSVEPKKAEALKKLDAIIFAGGPIALEAGQALHKYTKLYNGIGTSEASMYPMVVPDVDDPYTWFQFSDMPGFVLEPEADGLYELVFRRQDQVDWPAFHTFPEIDVYRTSDLYERHPSVPSAWRLISRKDEVLVLSNGEKVVPMPMEDIIRLAPEVVGVLYSGQGKFTVAAVIELEETESRSKEEVLKLLTPYINRANEKAPAFAHLTPDMIVFTEPGRPMKRTPKGSFIRKAVLKEYATELEALYDESNSRQEVIKLVEELDEAGTIESLTSMFKELSGKTMEPNEDLFQAGIDSMQVMTAARILRASVQAESKQDTKVNAGMIYEHPTVEQLARAVRSLVIHGSADSGNDNVEAMEAMLLKYSEGITSPKSAASLSAPETVILTGSTGSLGSYMLDELIRTPSIKKVYALNRSTDAESRQTASSSSRGLSTDFSKITFMTADFGSKNFGVSAYRELVQSADLIIHNAWSVDFNKSLSSFEPHIRGVRSFIDLASESPRNPHIVFISSIGTASSWESIFPGKTVPEALLRDPRVAAGQGYGEGKYVGEHMLSIAAAAAGVNATVCRVGQVAGPVEHGEQGVWNKQEWFPSIVASSKYLGLLPESFGNDVANWVPVDSMAKAIIELGQKAATASAPEHTDKSRAGGAFNVYNLVNPKGGSYKALIATIRKHLPEVEDVVSYERWVQALRESAEARGNDVEANPASKLLDFYAGLVGHGMSDAFETGAAVASSAVMAELRAVGPEWMDVWMRQWRF